MEISEQTDYRHFQREECYHYLANFPQRQQSGCDSELNVLVVSEVTARSVSMKLRRASVLKKRQQNVEDYKAWESNKVSTRSFRKNVDSTCSEISSVVLSDSDSSQSDDDDVLDLSVVKDVINRAREVNRPPNRLREKDEIQNFVEVQKISLAPIAMAEDTLEKLKLMRNTTEPVESEAEIVKDCESGSDESSEFLVRSGPSSPNPAVNTARCGECESLFTKMRRQPPSKTVNRDKNPESLSCDQWVLLKKWHRQRGRHRKKGLLWISLVQIRKLALQGSDSSYQNRSQTVCSRPHVFQQRNLRRCQYLAPIQTDLSVPKAKPRHRKRQRSADWPPIGWRKPAKRKSSMNSTLSLQLFSPKLSISFTQEGKMQTEEFSGLNASSSQDSRVSFKQKRNNVQDRFDKQEACDGVDGTRRVLKFDDTPEVVAVETAEPIRSPRRQLESEEICEAQNGVETKVSNGLQGLFEDSDGFKTPTDLFGVKPKIKRGYQIRAPASGDTKPTQNTANFRSLLATVVKNRNKIIKETLQ